MAFTVDKIPEIIEVNERLTNPVSPDMAVIVGVGAPANQVSLSQICFNVVRDTCYSLSQNR